VSPFLGSNDLFVYMEPSSPKVLDMRRDVLFELMIEEAMATVYENGRPKRSRWGAA
jgi:hypothetical protein